MQPNPDVISQRLEDTSMVLLHLRTNRFFELNRTGARFWELFSSGLGLHDVKEKMMEEFEIESVQLSEDVEELLKDMKKEDLVISK